MNFDSDKFINLIEERPCLYAIKSAEYMDKNFKENAWKVVSDSMNLPGK